MEEIGVLFILSLLLGLWIEATSFFKKRLVNLATRKSLNKTNTDDRKNIKDAL